MRIEQQHALSIEEVKKRADALADSITAVPLPGDVTLGDTTKIWHEDKMDFSFRVEKGFFGATIKGNLAVTPAVCMLEIDVPPVLSSFIDEGKITSVIQQRMAELLR